MSKFDKLLKKLEGKLKELDEDINEDTEFVVTIEQDGKVLEKIKTKACIMAILKEDMETVANVTFCQTTSAYMMHVLDSLEEAEEKVLDKLVGGLLD